MEQQLQQTGVDLTLGKVFSFSSAGRIDFDNKERKLSETKEIPFENEGWVELKKGCYKIQYNEIVKIPSDCAGFGLTRSSLLRCGAFVSTALWDPGYEGRSESLLIVENPKGISLKKNAKVLQLIFIMLEKKSEKLYEGKFKGENI